MGTYASFEEAVKGSTEAGKSNNLRVLSRNPYEVRQSEKGHIKVEAVMVSGGLVYPELD